MRKRRWAVAAIAGLLGLPLGWADQEFQKLREEFDQAQQKCYADLQAKYEKGGGGPAFNMAEDPPPIRDYRPKFKALAEKNAGKPEAIEPLVWLVHNGNKRGVPAEKQKETGEGSLALQTLTEKHAADPAIIESLDSLRHATRDVQQELQRKTSTPSQGLVLIAQSREARDTSRRLPAARATSPQ